MQMFLKFRFLVPVLFVGLSNLKLAEFLENQRLDNHDRNANDNGGRKTNSDLIGIWKIPKLHSQVKYYGVDNKKAEDWLEEFIADMKEFQVSDHYPTKKLHRKKRGIIWNKIQRMKKGIQRVQKKLVSVRNRITKFISNAAGSDGSTEKPKYPSTAGDGGPKWKGSSSGSSGSNAGGTTGWGQSGNSGGNYGDGNSDDQNGYSNDGGNEDGYSNGGGGYSGGGDSNGGGYSNGGGDSNGGYSGGSSNAQNQDGGYNSGGYSGGYSGGSSNAQNQDGGYNSGGYNSGGYSNTGNDAGYSNSIDSGTYTSMGNQNEYSNDQTQKTTGSGNDMKENDAKMPMSGDMTNNSPMNMANSPPMNMANNSPMNMANNPPETMANNSPMAMANNPPMTMTNRGDLNDAIKTARNFNSRGSHSNISKYASMSPPPPISPHQNSYKRSSAFSASTERKKSPPSAVRSSRELEMISQRFDTKYF